MADEQIAETAALENKLERKGPKTFLDLVAQGTEGPPIRVLARPAPEQVDSWVAERPNASKAETITLKIGWPEVCDLPVPCLAIAQYNDRIEMFSVDGVTHRLSLGEVSL